MSFCRKKNKENNINSNTVINDTNKVVVANDKSKSEIQRKWGLQNALPE